MCSRILPDIFNDAIFTCVFFSFLILENSTDTFWELNSNIYFTRCLINKAYLQSNLLSCVRVCLCPLYIFSQSCNSMLWLYKLSMLKNGNNTFISHVNFLPTWSNAYPLREVICCLFLCIAKKMSALHTHAYELVVDDIPVARKPVFNLQLLMPSAKRSTCNRKMSKITGQ